MTMKKIIEKSKSLFSEDESREIPILRLKDFVRDPIPPNSNFIRELVLIRGDILRANGLEYSRVIEALEVAISEFMAVERELMARKSEAKESSKGE